MREMSNTTRDVARELARKYSTMTHDELDILESVLIPRKYAKGEMVLSEGEICTSIILAPTIVKEIIMNKRQ